MCLSIYLFTYMKYLLIFLSISQPKYALNLHLICTKQIVNWTLLIVPFFGALVVKLFTKIYLSIYLSSGLELRRAYQKQIEQMERDSMYKQQHTQQFPHQETYL